VLHKDDFKPFKIHVTHALHDGDPVRRVGLCNWLTERMNEDENFLKNIIWTDECKLTNVGMFNRNNEHYWARENPQQFREVRRQVRFGLNVWVGLYEDVLIGPIIYEENLNGEMYDNFLRTRMLDLLDEVPLNRLQNMWWQQDGAPPHNTLRVRNTLNEMFPNKWIGNRGPVEWPARSPDLSPCDFFLWGRLKDLVYGGGQNPGNVGELRVNILAAFA
jgi:hypothetical protein